MIRTCKQLAAALNEVNNETIQVVKEHGYYIVKCGGYESHIAYKLMTAKQLKLNSFINFGQCKA